MDRLERFLIFLLLPIYGIFSENLSYRLPNSSYPEDYTIALMINKFDQDDLTPTYTGTVTINIRIVEDTDTIVLHSSVSRISEVVVTSDERDTIPTDLDFDKDREFLIVKTGNILEKNSKISMRIMLNGIIETEPQGIYRGDYFDKDGNKRYYIATHMKPTYARQVFPCYDEPRFKSKFTISIVNEPQYSSIANMDLTKLDETQPNKVVRIFKTTPPISTFLLGFAIFNFEPHEVIQNEINFRGFSRPGFTEYTKFGVDTAVQAMTKFENYFDAKYELEKLDQVALPKFAEVGMESHGIYFYQEYDFLYEAGATTFHNKEIITINVIHQICHAFIGNTLAIEWWSYAWMSEGFCRFFEYQMAQEIHPEMKIEELFTVNVLQKALQFDSSPSTHSMTSHVETPTEIRRVLDTVSHDKAASILNMFRFAISDDNFRELMQKYTSTDDVTKLLQPDYFYEALRLSFKNNTFDIVNAFKTWELQSGYPVLFIERNYNGNDIRIRQQRFTDDIVSNKTHDELWSIPISFSSNTNRNFPSAVQFWIQNRNTTITIDGLRPSHFFLTNLDQIGFFRVMYDESNWMRLADELSEGKFDNFSPKTRAMLIDDAATFMTSDILHLRIFLELIKYLKHETEYITWITATKSLDYIRKMMNDGQSELYRDFQDFLQILSKKVLESYGVAQQNRLGHQETHIRNIAITFACESHSPLCLKQTADLFNKILHDSNFKVSSDHKETIMCNGARRANINQFEMIWEMYQTSDNQADKNLLLKTLGCIEDYDILRAFLMKFDKVEDDDWLTVIQAVYTNGPIGLKAAVDFLDAEFEAFNEFIKNRDEQSSLNLIFEKIASRIITAELFGSFKNLMIKYQLAEDLKNLLSQKVQKNLMWIETNSPIIRKFLDDYNGANLASKSFIFVLFSLALQYFWR